MWLKMDLKAYLFKTVPIYFSKISNILIMYSETLSSQIFYCKQGGTKFERFLPKNQHTQRKLLNFENWCSGELSKIGHHFRK